MVLLDDRVAKSFPTAKSVNEALLGLLALANKSTRITIKVNRDREASHDLNDSFQRTR